MNHIIDQLNEVTKRFSDEVFLSNHGLSNEVGIHVFCYDPKEEIRVFSFFSDLIQTGNQPFHLKECDLYRIFLQICEEKRILKSIPSMEKKKGSEYLLKQLQKAISPEDFVKKCSMHPTSMGTFCCLPVWERFIRLCVPTIFWTICSISFQTFQLCCSIPVHTTARSFHFLMNFRTGTIIVLST